MANGTLNALAVADVAMLAGTVMLADPLKLVPFIVRAVWSVVAVAALPVVDWLPAAFTPGRLMLADPLKDTPPMVRAVCRVVAVDALPDNAAVIVPAEKLPDPSRATTFEAVLADVASTAHVVAAEPLKFEPVR